MHVNPGAVQTIPLLRLLVSPRASVGGHGPGVASGSSSIRRYHFIPVGHRSMVRDGPLGVLINQVANAWGRFATPYWMWRRVTVLPVTEPDG